MPDSPPTDRPNYLTPLKARWWLIAIIALVATVGTYRYYAAKPVSYFASTDLYMVPQSVQSILGQQGQTGTNFLSDQAFLIRTPAIADVAAHDLGYKGDPSALLGVIAVAPISGADVLTISATTANPVDAGRIANAFARAYISTQKASAQRLAAQSVKQLEQALSGMPQGVSHAAQRAQLASQIAQLQLYATSPTAPARQVTEAGPGAPSASNAKSHAIYGLALGVLFGAILAYALDAMSRRVKRLEDIEQLYGAAVVAKVPTASRRICATDPRLGLQSPFDEAFRGLRAALELRSMTQASDPEPDEFARLRTIMIASAAAGDGKSLVARNLALAYVEAGQRVAIVDCDLRRPELSRIFALDANPGLPDVLTGAAMTTDALRLVEVKGQPLPLLAPAASNGRTTAAKGSPIQPGNVTGATTFEGDLFAELAVADTTLSPQQTHPGLFVLPSSRPSANPAGLFAGGRLEAILHGLRGAFDVVILDTSPLAVVSDAAPLLPVVDGVLLVSRLEHSPTAAVEEMRSMLDAVPSAHIIGVVANDVRQRSGAYAYARGYETL